MPAEILVEIHGLRKHYQEAHGERAVFDDLALTIPRGEFLALLGRSGSGKSTLLNLLAGIDSPDAGSVRIGGSHLETLTEAERTRFRRRWVGFVFQFFNLIPTLTVAENTALPLTLNGLDDRPHRQWHHTLLDRVGLAGRLGSFPDQLSGGEQQRLALVRALVHRPRLLLADEPTGNLDETTGEQVLELLREFTADTGTTVVMVTHSREVAALADRRLWLHEGRLEALP
jgi:putative ABC transport system ATP-binding protein